MLLALGVIANAAVAHPADAAPTHLCQDDPSRSPSSLTVLACTLRDGLPPLAPETQIVSRPLPEGSPEGARAFALRLTALVASATGARDGGLSVTLATSPSPATEAEPGSTPSSNMPSTKPVLLLEPHVEGTALHVNATLLGKRASIWARIKGGSNQILAHTFASRTLDAELRSYLPAVPLVQPALQAFASPLSQLNAIACGDIDRDGIIDVAVTNRQEVAWGTLIVDGFVPRRTAALSSLSPVATVPLREPLASLWMHGATLELSTTDREHWLQLDPQLEVLEKRPQAWGVGPGLCVPRGASTAGATTAECSKTSSTTVATHPTFDRNVVVSSSPPLRAWRDATTGNVTVTQGEHTWTLVDRGAQIALADLNNDGTWEVVTTSSTLLRNADKVAVHSLIPSNPTPMLLWEVPVTAGIDGVAVCPPEANKQSAIVLASNNHVGVLQ